MNNVKNYHQCFRIDPKAMLPCAILFFVAICGCQSTRISPLESAHPDEAVGDLPITHLPKMRLGEPIVYRHFELNGALASIDHGATWGFNMSSYTNTRNTNPIRLHWQSSVTESNCPTCEDLEVIKAGKPYQVRIALVEKDLSAGVATQSFESFLRQLNEEHGRFKLVPIFLDGISSPIGTDPKPLDLIVRKPEIWSDTWGEVLLDFRVLSTARPCGQVIFSVWDYDMRIAMDAFMVTLPLTSECRHPMHSEDRIEGPSIVSISDVFSAPSDQPSLPSRDRISIYAFQLPVFTKDSYAFSVLAPQSGAVSVHGWKLDSSLYDSFGDQAATFNQKAEEDRQNMKAAKGETWIYKATSQYISDSLFSGADTGSQLAASKALADIKDFVNSRTGVDVISQVYLPKSSDEIGLMFLPLRIMAGANSQFFSKDFNLLSPLPGPDQYLISPPSSREQKEPDCIADWQVVLDGDMAKGEQFESLKRLVPMPWRGPTLHKYEDIVAYFDPDSSSPELASSLARSKKPGGTGLIIAAHYGGKKLGLDRDLVLPVKSMKRLFPPSSAAILAACETAAPAEASGIISRLRTQNVSSFLASPLKVPTPYAVSMVSYLTKRIDKAYEEGKTPTLRELYQEAMLDAGMEDPTDVAINNLGREYVIVGNSNVRLCKLPLEEKAP